MHWSLRCLRCLRCLCAAALVINCFWPNPHFEVQFFKGNVYLYRVVQIILRLFVRTLSKYMKNFCEMATLSSIGPRNWIHNKISKQCSPMQHSFILCCVICCCIWHLSVTYLSQLSKYNPLLDVFHTNEWGDWLVHYAAGDSIFTGVWQTRINLYLTSLVCSTGKTCLIDFLMYCLWKVSFSFAHIWEVVVGLICCSHLKCQLSGDPDTRVFSICITPPSFLETSTREQ